MDPEKATAWLEFLGKLTATVLVYMFALYAGYSQFRDAEVWTPKLAAALEGHAATTSTVVAALNSIVTNTEETARLARVQCKATKKLAREDDRECEIRKVVLGNTIVP